MTISTPPTEVDVVYTWVNHLDPDWQAMYKKAVNDGKVPNDSHSSVNDIARFQNRNEIQHSISSLRMYAPWVRKIFIVTNCSLPKWAEDDRQIVRIDHKDIFPNSSDLPTFNAFAIEACLHLIPGLSEHFIYFNDDVFLLKPTDIEDFFPSYGVISVFQSKHDIPLDWHKNLRPVEYSMINAAILLQNRFGYTPKKKLHHAPFPLLKRRMEELAENHADQVAETRSHPFREKSDLPLSTTLHAYYCLAIGRARTTSIKCRYIDIGHPLFLLLVNPVSPLRRGKYQFLCLNEVNSIKVFSGLRDKIVIALMNSLFPCP